MKMFDVQKYEKIKNLYKLISYTDLLIVFSAFGFVYTIFMSSYIFMLYLICLASGITLREYLKNKIKYIENGEKEN